MNRLYFYLSSIIIFLCALIVLSVPGARSASERFTVVCTTSMICDTAKQIAGEHLQIKSLMGPGIDPHLYRATESDLYALSSADLILYNGLHLEGKMAEILQQINACVPAIAVAEIIPKEYLIESEFKGIYDPHVWLDVSLWIMVAQEIKKQLMQHDPSHAALYEKNAQHYIKKLRALDVYVRQLSADIPIKVMVTAHDAFAYFGKAYGFEVVGLQGISTDAQICPKDITAITHTIVSRRIPALFLESSIPSRTIQAVQQAAASHGWHVAIAPELFSDALGDSSTTAHTYHGMIEHNMKTIVYSLGK